MSYITAPFKVFSSAFKTIIKIFIIFMLLGSLMLTRRNDGLVNGGSFPLT